MQNRGKKRNLPPEGKVQRESVLITVRKAMLSQVSGDVIELCGGNGRSLPYFPIEHMSSLTVVDNRFSTAVKEFDFGRLPVTFVPNTNSKLPISNCSYDYACVFLALSAIKEPYVALAEIRRVLRPGGQILFMEYDRPRGFAGLVFDGTHFFKSLTSQGSVKRNIMKMLDVAGFKVENVASCGRIFLYGVATKR